MVPVLASYIALEMLTKSYCNIKGPFSGALIFRSFKV